MPEDQSRAVQSALAALEPVLDQHRKLGRAMLTADNASLYSLDLLATAAINRSMAHMAGFRQMVEARNFICAASILRLQLDTAMRFAAAWLAPDPHLFAHEVLKGTSIRKLKDRDGQNMTDSYLVSVLAKEDPWITNVYKQTSGYIHLSEKHIFNSVTAVGDDRRIEMKMSSEDAVITDALYLESIEAFQAATEVFLRYLEGWIVTKAHPELTTRGRGTDGGTPNSADA